MYLGLETSETNSQIFVFWLVISEQSKKQPKNNSRITIKHLISSVGNIHTSEGICNVTIS